MDLGQNQNKKNFSNLDGIVRRQTHELGQSGEQKIVGTGLVDEDNKKRLFLKLLGVAGLGVIGSFLWPKKADAYVFGSTPSANVVGVKNASNNKINPATEETLTASIAGQAILKKTITLTDSGPVHTPAADKKVRVYNSKFSLSANMASVAFRFTSTGTDYEKYLAPKTGGLYGANNQPNYVEGGLGEAFYCDISGTGTVQINLDYLEV